MLIENKEPAILKNEMLAHVDIPFSKMLCAIFSRDTQRKHNGYHQKKKTKNKNLSIFMPCNALWLWAQLELGPPQLCLVNGPLFW